MRKYFGAVWFLGLLFASAPALQATTVVLPTDDQLVEKTPLIIRGRVLDSRPVEHNGGIYTETTVLVEKTLKGTAPGSTVLIRELGGDLGERMTVIFGAPSFQVDESVLLFLARGPEDAYRVRDMFVGKFSERFAQDGTRLWYRGNEDGVTLLDRELEPVSMPNVQRRAEGFESFITAASDGVATSSASAYVMENPVLKREGAGATPDRLQQNFTLISDPSIYRWSSFDGGGVAEWRHVSSQPGYSGGGVSEVRAGMAAWTSYSAAKILYEHAGAFTGTPGGHRTDNGVNEVVFNDVTNEIDGTYSSRSGGVVGIGGFNRAMGGGTWNGPFNADATHTARSYSSVTILEGNLVIQDGVTPQNGISSHVLAEIIAHEFGHTLGFGHSEDGAALMYRSVTGGGPSLKADDQVAARWLYPASSGGGGTPEPTPTVPAAPSNLRASALDSTRVQLDWSDRATNETSQRVYVAVGSGAFDAVGDVAANQTTVGLSGLNPGTTYRFRVTSLNGAGESSASNTVELTMPSGSNSLSAGFSYSPTSPEVNQTISFTDGSSGSISAWRWVFGDGTSSTARNPEKRYTSAGTFAVTLTVSNVSGSASVTRNVTVRERAVAVNAAFTYSPSSPLAGQWITFSDQSTGNPTSWQWTYGDGSTSTQRNPQKRYTSPGSYTVTLRVSNGSSSASTTRTLSIGSSTPATPTVVAAFDASTSSTTVGNSVSFTDRSSGSPTSWSWNFGDGATSSSRNPSHVYTRTGTYTVTLTARNSGSSAVASKSISVKSDPRYRSVLPVAAQTSGASDTNWRTELSIHNAGSRGATVELKFLPADGGAPAGKSVYIAAGSTANYGNALRDLFGIGSGSGALAIESVDHAGTPDLRVASRTFTGSSSGTYGQFVPGEDGDREVRTMYLTGLASNGDFRTNIGLANASSTHVEVTLTLFGAAGETIGSTVVGIGGNGFRQMALASLFPQIAGRNHPVLSARLQSSRTDRWYGYASVVDNRSQDPIFVRAMPGAGRTWTIPAVGRNAGAEGTYWRSDVTIYNPTSSSMGVTLHYLAAGQDNSSAPSRSETIPAGRTVRINDVLARFGVNSGSGALRITANSGTPIIASRTYTTRSDGGSFGQSIDAVAASEFGSESVITGLRSDGSYRTNIGLANGSSGWANVTLRLVRPNGSVVATRELALPARSQTQMALGAMFPGINTSALGTATVRASAQSGEVVAYGSVIDNQSGDPIYIQGE